MVGYFNDAVGQFGPGKIFIIPGVVAYVTFIFTGYATKWSKELENPYTYLIPDTPLKKVWYSTKIEHYRAIVDGILVIQNLPEINCFCKLAFVLYSGFTQFLFLFPGNIRNAFFKKVWYSTKIEHYRAIVDGILVTVPGAIVFGIGPVMTAKRLPFPKHYTLCFIPLLPSV